MRILLSKGIFLTFPLIVRKKNKYLLLTYDNFAFPYSDGQFAQLHRLIAISALGNYFKCNVNIPKLSDLTITPLDNFKKNYQLQNQIEALDGLFKFKKKKFKKFKYIQIQFLNTSKFLRFYIFSRIFKQNITLGISNPFPIIEIFPEIYSSSKPILQHKQRTKLFHIKKNLIQVSIHIRRGVYSSHVTPGELNPRVLPLTYFQERLLQIFAQIDLSKKIVVNIYTDAPKKTIFFKVPKSQLDRYRREFKLIDNKMLKVEGETFDYLIKNFPQARFNIYRGGNAIESFFSLISSDFLIMSRSSMSFVAALYSKGKIIYPPGFWHKPLKSWIK